MNGNYTYLLYVLCLPNEIACESELKIKLTQMRLLLFFFAVAAASDVSRMRSLLVRQLKQVLQKRGDSFKSKLTPSAERKNIQNIII